MTPRCRECGGEMVPVDGFTWHPSCSPTDPSAARIRSEHAAREAGLAGMTQAATGSPDDFLIALGIIRTTACKVRVFSANSISDPESPFYDARWQHLGSKIPGAAMGHASRRGWCKKTGHTVPSLLAKGCHIPQWESRIYVDEFAAGLLTGQAR